MSQQNGFVANRYCRGTHGWPNKKIAELTRSGARMSAAGFLLTSRKKKFHILSTSAPCFGIGQDGSSRRQTALRKFFFVRHGTFTFRWYKIIGLRRIFEPIAHYTSASFPEKSAFWSWFRGYSTPWASFSRVGVRWNRGCDEPPLWAATIRSWVFSFLRSKTCRSEQQKSMKKSALLWPSGIGQKRKFKCCTRRG